MQRANEQKKRLCLSFLWVQQSIAKYSIVTAWFFHVNITSGGVSEFCFGDWWLFLVVSQFGVELSYLWNQLSPLLWSGSRISADWDRKKYIKSTHFKLYFHWKWQKPLCYNLAEIIRRGFYGIVQNIWAVPSHWFGKKCALQKNVLCEEFSEPNIIFLCNVLLRTQSAWFIEQNGKGFVLDLSASLQSCACRTIFLLIMHFLSQEKNMYCSMGFYWVMYTCLLNIE